MSCAHGRPVRLRDTAAPLYKIIPSLKDGALSRVPIEGCACTVEFLNPPLPHLPGVFFNSDCTDCGIMAITLLGVLYTNEKLQV